MASDSRTEYTDREQLRCQHVISEYLAGSSKHKKRMGLDQANAKLGSFDSPGTDAITRGCGHRTNSLRALISPTAPGNQAKSLPELQRQHLPNSQSVVASDVEPKTSINQLWNPFWLRRWVLLGFVGMFIAMIFTVAALYRISKDQHGVAKQVKANQYTWNYGPTAFLVAVASLWHHVDHHCKLLLPWQNLRYGADARQTLLLDYISPMAPTTLWAASRDRHWSIVASVVASLLLKLTVCYPDPEYCLC